MVRSLIIPVDLKKEANSLDVYSPPLSVLKVLILFLLRFSISYLNS
jgi:hypothetical protein